MGGAPVFSFPETKHNLSNLSVRHEDNNINNNEERAPVIDILRDYQYGKNGSIEYRWSPYAPERFVQLFYQATTALPDKENIKTIMTEYWDLLRKAVCSNNTNDKIHLYKLLLHCRDRRDGKGSWTLCLHLLCVVLREDYMGFLDLFSRMVGTHKEMKRADTIGCWRDFRELQFLLQKSDLVSAFLPEDLRHAAVEDLTEVCVGRLIEDNKILKEIQRNEHGRRNDDNVDSDSTRHRLSMLGKWFPREKGKFGWLYNQMYKKITKDSFWREALRINVKADLRSLLSKLNQHLDTLEVKQCKRNWHKIDFSKVSTSRLLKQVDSFMGKRKNDIDRRLCKKRLQQQVQSVESLSISPPPSRPCESMILGEVLGKLVLQANVCMEQASPPHEKVQLIDTLWVYHLEKMKREWDEAMCNKDVFIFPLIDLSSSMVSEKFGEKGTQTSTSPQVYNAIATGLYLSHVSRQDTVIVFGTSASIINLEDEGQTEQGQTRQMYSLCKVVNKIMNHPRVGLGSISGIQNAMNTFVQVYTSHHRHGKSANDREYLVILSDFQFSPNYNVCNIRNINSRNIPAKKVDESIRSTVPVSSLISSYLCQLKGATTPHAVYWNMTSTSGFPGLSFFEKTIFMSGANPRNFLHAIKPLKLTEKRENVPKRVKGMSSESMMNIDGNNIRWSSTPCYYVHRALNQSRYEN